MSASLVRYERDGHLATITLNRPEKLNALNRELLTELRSCWIRYRDDEDAWVAILTHEGRAFTAGADKQWFVDAGESVYDEVLELIFQDPYWGGGLDKPTIVAVRGWVIGAGVDLVLRADLRIAGDDAQFHFPEVERGNVVLLWDNLPYAMAAELLSGSVISAQRAYDVGMVNRVVPADRLLEAAQETAHELLRRSPLALYHALKVLREVRDAGLHVPFHMLRSYTTQISKELTRTADWREAVGALLEKRTPEFKKH